MENNKFFCFNLKLKAENLIACTSKEDLIELIRQSEDCQVEPIHSTRIEMARRKKIKNHTILTKYELRKALGLTTENNDLMNKTENLLNGQPSNLLAKFSIQGRPY